MQDFKDKTVWITGASSGIGKALALALARKQARLILSSRNVGRLEQVREACLAHTQQATVQALDLEQYHLIPGIATKVLEQHPKIDLLINNGGVSQRALAMDTSLAVDKRIMDINFMGTVALTKAVLPSMLKHDIGHIATITSLVGKFGTPLRSTYSASKHALHGFFDALRAELQQDGHDIHISLIAPGYIRTQVSINALTGNGAPQDSMDEATQQGLPPEIFAQKALRAIQKQKRECYIGQKEIWAVYLKRFFPGYFASRLVRAKVT